MKLRHFVGATALLQMGLPASAAVTLTVESETESEVVVSISMADSEQALAIGLHGLAQGLCLPEVFEMASGTRAAAKQDDSAFLLLVGSSGPFAPILPIDAAGQVLLRGSLQKTSTSWCLSLTSADLIQPGGEQFAIISAPVNDSPLMPETAAPPIGLEVYPNPGWDRILLSLGGEAESVVGLRVYDAQGRVVRDLAAAQRMAASRQEPVAWDGCDSSGRHLGAGIYFARVFYRGGAEASCKLTLIR
ncbi:T9SS type A sorting domain-containing protein [bacterium]|nr:T9SS type A sorting domain-containing protein [bacterium]